MAMILLTSGVVLLLTCAAFFAYEFLTFRQAMIRQLATLGEIIAANSTAALAFDNPDDAQEILAALQAERHIVAASLYDQNGRLFSKYPADLPVTAFPVAPEADGYRFAHLHLAAFQPVVQGGKRLGTLYLKSDMGAMYERFQLYSGIVVLVLAGSLLVAYALSRALQRRISRPILALAETAKAISDRRDYSVRAIKHSQDELGLLTDAFNQMLTQIHEQDQALRDSEERLRLLLSATHSAAWDWDIATDRLWHQENLAAGTEGALSNGEGAGTRWLERVHPVDRERVVESLKALLAGIGEVWSEEYRYRTAEGSYAHILERGVVIRKAGKPVRMLGAMLDITERKRAEEEIQKLNQELERRVIERTAQLEAANQELEAFSYSVSHDLRAPLRAIDGFSMILQESYGDKLDAQAHNYLERVRAATQRMGHLIDDLLKLSRTTRSEMCITTVNLSELVCTIAKGLEETAPERKVTFSIAPQMVVHADASLMRVVLENLLGNAWKFSGKRAEARIEVGSTTNAGETVYFVRDNGAGFDMKYADKLFGAFQRLHSVTAFDGTGVGLANVQRIIHRHGGRVWAEAAVDQGATFYFTLSARGSSYAKDHSACRGQSR